VIDIWTIGPTAAAFHLRRQGFTPRQAERLVALRLRHERGELNELTYDECRRRFYRWLVEHARFTDWPQDGASQPGGER
jgi:hypothetical protein